MCLAKAYFKEGDEGEPILENVASLEVKDHSLVLTTIMKETREIEARLSSVNFRNGSIVLERTG